MGIVKVVNKRDLGRPQKAPEGTMRVAIHRGTPLGNPFKMANSSEEERERVCEEYEEWIGPALLEKGAEWRQFQFLKQMVKENERVELICYCAPLRCHGDTIKRLLEREANEG